MSCFSAPTGIAFFSSIFGTPTENISLINKAEIIVPSYKTRKVVVPERPLAPGSIQIRSIANNPNFSENALKEEYSLIQKIVGFWATQQIVDYLIYEKKSLSDDSISYREIVPYPKNGLQLWQQLKVLWNISFGAPSQSNNLRFSEVTKFTNYEVFSRPYVNKIEDIQEIVKGTDPFCRETVIEKQWVFKGTEVNVLYDAAPIANGDKKFHFLIIPQRHCEKFSDLTESEYVESQQLSQHLADFCKKEGCDTAFIFQKTGERAGQSVNHCHLHLVATATKTQQLFGKLTVFKNMLIGASGLSEDELKNRVNNLRVKLVNLTGKKDD